MKFILLKQNSYSRAPSDISSNSMPYQVYIIYLQ